MSLSEEGTGEREDVERARDGLALKVDWSVIVGIFSSLEASGNWVALRCLAEHASTQARSWSGVG